MYELIEINVFLLYKQHRPCDVDFDSLTVDLLKTPEQHTIRKLQNKDEEYQENRELHSTTCMCVYTDLSILCVM